jgi:hypothetical protein
MSDMRIYPSHGNPGYGRDGGVPVGARGTRDGALFVAPWKMALVMEGRVFTAQAGVVTTGIAGHATIDADQPEFALRAASDSLVILPLRLQSVLQTGETTLGIAELMWAASTIDVGNGTSTATGVARNLNFASSNAASAVTRHTYSGNGTDPLTVDNYTELARVAGIIDSDAATSGMPGLRLLWTADQDTPVIVARTGCVVGYNGAGTAVNGFFVADWAEFTQAEIE